MKMTKKRTNKYLIVTLGVILLIALSTFGYFKLTKPNEENFKAPGKTWNSPKKVESYFVEHMHMTSQEANEIRSKPGVDGKVNLRIDTNVTLEGLISNLYYYGFVRNENTLRFTLEHTKDTTPNDKSIKVGKEGTIDTNAEYRISENMSAWEIADILLNKPSGHFTYDEYNYFFMP
jgi:hypothetical protein